MWGVCMQVIDFHVHVGDFNLLREDIQELLMKNAEKRDFDEKKIFNDPNNLAEYLRASNVKTAVLLGEDGPGTNYHITSDFVCSFKKRARKEYQDMFICFGSINTNKETDLISKYNDDIKMGVLGYKLYPGDHNFDPKSNELMEVYKLMEQNRHVLMFHTGGSAQRDTNNKYNNPEIYEEIAERFRNLTLVLCHGGIPDKTEVVTKMMLKHENVFIDTGFIKAETLLKYFPNIESVSHKILFASDLPGGVRSLNEYIQEYKDLNISIEAKENILFKNAHKILDLIGSNE